MVFIIEKMVCSTIRLKESTSLFLLFFLLAFPGGAQQKSRDVLLPKSERQLANGSGSADTSLDSFCRQDRSSLIRFFGNINLTYPGLGKVKQAVERKDWPTACKQLLHYYGAKPMVKSINTIPELPTDAVKEATAAFQHVFTFQGITDTLPKTASGHFNWLYQGPNNDVEWAYFLNRMGYLSSLHEAYRQTQQPRFARLYNSLVLDWVLANPTPAGEVDNATWRVLEVGLRLLGPWSTTFYQFQKTDLFTPVTRMLMLMSIHDQASYVRRYHRTHHNHGVMELNGLTKAAFYFPEFKQSGEWYQHALAGMSEEFSFLVYPDGAMKELTNSYHWVVVRNFLTYLDLLKTFGKPVPASMHNTVEKMCSYMLYTARPDGDGLLNNNADLLNNVALLKPLLPTFHRPDWQYIMTSGKAGKKPVQTSVIFPWAGHFIMRNGWGLPVQKSQFAFFDVGPWGTAHQHNDKLHLSVFAGGREILCDAGRLYYKVDKWRQYFNLSAAHNVVLLDGRGQDKTVEEALTPLPPASYSLQPELDFCMGTYNGGFNDINPHVKMMGAGEPVSGQHTRAVIYLKNKYWIVVDQVKTDKPRTVTANWHFNPQCAVVQDGSTVFTNDTGKGNLVIIPASMETWKVGLLKGQEEPSVQGWYSEKYNQRVPAICAEYKTEMPAAVFTFAWVLYPSATTRFPAISVQLLPAPPDALRLQVNIPGEEKAEVAVNLGEVKPISLSNGYQLNGRCAVLRQGKQPLVVQGELNDQQGKRVAESKPD